MPPTQTKEQAPPRASVPPPKCMVTPSPDGAASVQFYIDPQRWSRLQRKMGSVDPAMFLWENLINRMIDGATY